MNKICPCFSSPPPSPKRMTYPEYERRLTETFIQFQQNEQKKDEEMEKIRKEFFSQYKKKDG